jgi:peptidoglycan/LPS O-acetylase OafA/YrhL
VQNEIRALTGLRGLAAVWVLAAHFFSAYGVESWIAGSGQFGVFLFFVLSGFILGYVHDCDFNRPFGFSTTLRFLGLRLAKIYPLHAAITLIWALVLVPLHIWPTVARDTGEALGLNLLLVHAWGFLQEYTWNMPSWSISVEWLCYLLFPLLPLLLSGRSLIVLFGVAVALQTAIYTAAPVTLLGFLSGTGPAVSLAAGKQALYYFQIFFLGYTCFLIGKRLSINSVPPLLWDALAATVLAVGFVASPRDDFVFWIPLASAALIFCLAQRGPVSEILLGNAIMRYLGEISYSVYMCHIMAYAVLIWAWYGILGGKPAMWVAFLVSLGVAAVAYHLVEQPARRAIRKWIVPHRSSSIVPPTAEPSLVLMTPVRGPQKILNPVSPKKRLNEGAG